MFIAHLIAISIALASPVGQSSESPPATKPPAPVAQGVTLAAAPSEERLAIDRLRASASWVRRSLAAQRLARFDCDESAELLRGLARDSMWQVRCYAIQSCSRRGIALAEGEFAKESESRVIRTALRCRYKVPAVPLEELARRLTKSEKLEDKVLALELILAADLPEGKSEREFDREALLSTIVMRMERVEAGALSPRLAAITSGGDSGRSYLWRDWYRKNRKNLGLHGAFVVPVSVAEREAGFTATLASDRFIELERHVEDLGGREIDLAILLDCTASMSGEIAECQAGVDALMLFAQSVAKDLRIAIVGYRDKHDKWETKAWDFTSSIAEARDRLWSLSAEGGGDRPESVFEGLKLAYSKLAWRPNKSLSTVLIGDAPPHPGTGELCVSYAKQAHQGGITTYAIAPHAELLKRGIIGSVIENDPGHAEESPDKKPDLEPDNKKGPQPYFRKRTPGSPWRQKLGPGEVAYFAEIAEAGGGRAVALPRDASLISEIAGITLGEKFQDEIQAFFEEWMALCR